MEEIFIPATGMAMEQAELIEWLKQPGEAVHAGEPVVLIETDKATTEIVAESAGVLSDHLHRAGASVAAGQPIAYVLGPGEQAPGAPEPTPAAAALAERSNAGGTAPSAAGVLQAHAGAAHAESPRRRRLQREAAAAGANGSAQPDVDTVRDRSERAREHIGRAVTESWTTIPHFAVSREADLTELVGRLASLRTTAPLVSATDLLLRAVARAWCVFRGEPDPTIGISVATDRGVLNVSVPGAATQDLVALTAARRAAVDRARRGKLTAGDLADTSVTLSNLGTHGVDWFTGIIPMRQLALVTVGRVRRAVVVEGDAFRIRDMMWVTANLDHRHLDGADGAKLLDMFAEQCREPR